LPVIAAARDYEMERSSPQAGQADDETISLGRLGEPDVPLLSARYRRKPDARSRVFTHGNRLLVSHVPGVHLRDLRLVEMKMAWGDSMVNGQRTLVRHDRPVRRRQRGLADAGRRVTRAGTVAVISAAVVITPALAANASTPQFSLPVTSGPAGTLLLAQPVKNCPRTPAHHTQWVTFSFTDSTGVTTYQDSEETANNGSWKSGGIQIPYREILGLNPVTYGSDAALGEGQVQAWCYLDESGQPVTQRYAPRKFRVSRQSLRFRVSAATALPGGSVRLSAVDPCPHGTEQAYGAIDNSFGSSVGYRFSLNQATGAWRPDTVTIPRTLPAGAYAADPICYSPAGIYTSYANVLVTIKAAERYVALGDSVPYGHGLANPDKNTESGLPADQGPSPVAWPSLVLRALPGLAPLTRRPAGCALTGHGRHYDQLAISGAPTQVSQWTGKDTNCHYPAGVKVPLHKAVVPNEIDAADLRADPPALVTIQAGADDIQFPGCLEALLGFFPSQLGATTCVTHDKSGYHMTARAVTELTSVRAGLVKAIDTIESDAPHAQIVLVDYYQILPSATAPLQGSGLICRDMRFHGHLDKSYRKNLRDAADYVQGQLNDAIKSAAKSSPGVALVDIANLFSGHEMCTAHSWVFSDTNAWIRTDTWRAAHPTKTGQANIAKAVAAVCRKLADHCLRRGGSASARRVPPLNLSRAWLQPLTP
jgi:GDSL-like Lipase/Acylhydrolase family